ncbi:HlyD family secretion protein [Desulfitobacterium sp.]|uniref:HlyD family secretion protein n=1 Tax=Desulfitobacterium sp. TaxID=49981 RepID=UPI002B21AF38|nr:HlyD family efflux transporter periplasmic adaptor subunit [Desulfitobacterium sp.]MEA4902200.1 efflux RND transporter periplasmic adaptor subunit [Desulfitobacterium sp.]
MKRKIIALILLVSVLGTGVWLGVKNNLWNKSEDRTYSGTIETTEVPVQPEQGGRLTEVLVQEGQSVKVGDVLARQDDRAAKTSLEIAKGQLQQAQARLNDMLNGSRSEEVRRLQAVLAQAQATENGLAQNVQFERKNLADLQQLYSAGAVPKKDVDAEQNKLDSVNAQHESAKAQVEAAQATLDQALAGLTEPSIQAQKSAVNIAEQGVNAAQLSLEKTVIKSPLNGVVFYRHVEPGKIVNPGAPIVTLSDPEDLWIKVYVPDAELKLVKIGETAHVSVDAYPDQTFAGEITYISDQAEFTPKNVQTKEERTKMVYAVKVRLNEGKDVLKAGMPADVLFQ